MHRLVLLVLTVLLGGCGPIAIGVGLGDVLSSDPQDLGEPAVELETLDANGLRRPAPSLASVALVFQLGTNKPGVSLSALIVGPIPDNADPTELAAIERDYCDLGVIRVTPLSTREATGLSIVAADNVALNAVIANLADGRFTVHLRGVDGQGRSACASHTWVFDTLAPTTPRLSSVEAPDPRSLRVSWTVAQDLPASPSASPTGVSGYRVYFDVGQTTVPDAPRAANPVFDGTAKFGVLQGGTGDSPVFVAGSTTSSATLTGLFAMHMHYVRVTAVDNAGNETDLATAEEIARRTRSGGDGTFEPAITIPGGTEPGKTLTDDLDRDGHLDLVVADRGESNARVFFGAGDGTFSAPVVTPMGGPGVDAALADLNGDHVLDLFYLSANGVGVSHGTGNRAGPFGFPVGSDSGGSVDVRAMAVGDVTGDRLLDAIVMTIGASQGGGTVVTPEPHDGTDKGSGLVILEQTRFFARPLGSTSHCATLIMGKVVSCDSGSILVQEGSGSTGYSTGGAPRDFTVADFNSDRVPDLAVANTSGSVAILLGVGSASFLPPRLIEVGSAEGRITHGDFNGDGVLDLAVAGSIAGTVTLLFGDGDGGFALSGRAFGLSGTPTSIVAGDFNEDLILDVAVAIKEGDVQFLLGNGASGGPDLTYSISLSEPGAVLSVSAGDLNDDNVPDLVASLGAAGVDILLSRSESGQSRGSFLSRVNFRGPRLDGEALQPGRDANIDAVLIADINNDDILDLVGKGDARSDLNDPFIDAIPGLLGQGVGGKGFGTFQGVEAAFAPRSTTGLGPDCGPLFAGAAQQPAVADFNNDGTNDVAFITNAPFAGDHIGIFPSSRGGYLAECAWDSVAAADVNDDGKPDLVGAIGAFDVVNVLRGRGDGTFAGTEGVGYALAANGFAAGTSPARLLIQDFDRDGIPDIAAVNRGTNQISILRGGAVPFLFPQPGPGRAAGTFDTRTAYTFDQEPTEIAHGDLNRDGIPDLVVLQGDARKVSLLLSNAATRTHTVVAGFDVAGTGALTGVCVADFNSDGIQDIALGGDAIRVYSGRGAVVGD